MELVKFVHSVKRNTNTSNASALSAPAYPGKCNQQTKIQKFHRKL